MTPWLDHALARSRAPLRGRFFARGVEWPRWRRLERARRLGKLFDFAHAPPDTPLLGGHRRGGRRCWRGSLPPRAERSRLDFHFFQRPSAHRHAVVLNPGSSGIPLLERGLLVGPLLAAGFDVLILGNPGRPARGRRPGSGDRRGCSAARLVEGVVALAEGDVALARWLRARGYARVGVAGLGFGGVAAGHAAARSDAFDVCVIAMQGAHLADPWCAPAGLSHALDWRALRNAGIDSEAALRRLLEPFSLQALAAPSLPPGELMAARHDGLIPAESVARLAARWRWPVRWLSGGHGSVYTHRAALARSLASALDRAGPTREARGG